MSLTRPRDETLRLLLTARQAAEALAVSPRTLFTLKHRGELRALRIPGRGRARSIRYAVEDLEQWIVRTKAGANAAR